jgi:hypothetical protein
MKKKVIYNISKDQNSKSTSQKMKGLKKPNILCKIETLNHIII